LFKYEGRRTRLLSRAEAAILIRVEVLENVAKRDNQTIDEIEAVQSIRTSPPEKQREKRNEQWRGEWRW
jgi:hypothetical protein